MESTLLGLVLDSSTVIRAERSKQSIPDFIEAIYRRMVRSTFAISGDGRRTGAWDLSCEDAGSRPPSS